MASFLTPDDIKNIPTGQTVGSVLLNKNLRRIKRPNEKNKVGFQGKTNKPIEAGVKPISAGYKRQPVEAGVPTFTATPQYRNYIEKPPWERIKIYDVNDQFSTLKEMYRYYNLGSVVHPGLALGVLFSPALNRESIPFLFQGENFRNKLKELSAKYQPETITDLITGLPQRSFVQKNIIDPALSTAQRGLNILVSPGDVTGRMMKADDYIRFKALDSTLTTEEKKQIGWSGKYDERQIQNYLPDNRMSFSAQKTNPKIAVIWEAMKRPEYQSALEKYGSMSVGDTAKEYWSGIVRAAKDEKLEETAPRGTTKNVMQTVAARTQFHKNPVLNTLMELNTDPTILMWPFSIAAKESIQAAVQTGKLTKLAGILPQLEKSQTVGEVALRVGLRSGWDNAASMVQSLINIPGFKKLASEAGYIRFPWKAKGGDISNIELFTREVLRRPRETLKQLGAGGDKLERMMVKALLEGEEAAGTTVTKTRALFEKLPEKDWGHFVDVMEGRANPKNGLVAELADKVGLYRDYIAKIAPNMDFKIYNPKTGKLMPWKPVKDYFPRDLNWNLIKKDRNILADYLLKTKQAKDIDEAKKILSRQRWGEATAGHLEVARTFKLPDKYYVKSPQLTWERYVEEINKRLYERKVFGRKYENAFTAIEDIRKEIGGEDAKWAHDLFMEHVKGAITNKKDFTTPLRNYHIATKMTLSAIQNSTQKFVNESLDGNIRGILKATAQYRTTVGKEKALQTGAILRSVLEDQMKRIGLHADSLSGQVASEALKITKFSATETYNRIFTALKSFDQLDWALKKLVKNPKSKKYRSMFEPLVRYFDFDLDKAIKAGKLPSSKLQRMYANYQVIRKHFRGGSLFKPPGWNTRTGKLLTQFKTFIYDEGALVKDSIKTGLKTNNYTPLIALLTVFPAVGQIPAEIFAKIRGRERRWTGKDRVPGWPGDIPAPLARYIEGISYVGGFGLAYEILQSAEFGEKGIAGLLGGPTTSDVLGAGKGVYQAAVEKKPADLAKWLVRQIPGVGTTLKRKLYSEKGQPKWISLGTRRVLEKQRERGEESARTVNSFIEAVESGDRAAIKKAAESFKGTNYPIGLKSIQGAWSAKEQMGKKFWKLSDKEKAKAFEEQVRGIDEGKPSIPMVANKAVQEYLKAQPGGEKLLADLVAFKVGSIRDRNKDVDVKRNNRVRVRTAIAGFVSKNKSKSWQRFLQMYGGLVVPLQGKSFGSKEGKPRYEAFKKAIDELKRKDKQFAKEFMLIPNVFSSEW